HRDRAEGPLTLEHDLAPGGWGEAAEEGAPGGDVRRDGGGGGRLALREDLQRPARILIGREPEHEAVRRHSGHFAGRDQREDARRRGRRGGRPNDLPKRLPGLPLVGAHLNSAARAVRDADPEELAGGFLGGERERREDRSGQER